MKGSDEILNLLSMSEREQNEYFHSLPPDKSSTVLVRDLLKHPQSEMRDYMLARAKAYGYDDFRFTMLYDDCICPKMKLEEDAIKAGFQDIINNNRGGKYD